MPPSLTTAIFCRCRGFLPIWFSMVPVTVDAGTRQAPSEDGIEVVFPAATVRVGRAADPALLRTVLDCLARRR